MQSKNVLTVAEEKRLRELLKGDLNVPAAFEGLTEEEAVEVLMMLLKIPDMEARWRVRVSRGANPSDQRFE